MAPLDTFTNGFPAPLLRLLDRRLYVQIFAAILRAILELFVFDILDLYVTGCESIVGD